MASPQRTNSASSRGDGAPASRPRLGRRLVWLAVFLMTAAWALLEFPHEVARWHLAAALEYEEDGHEEAAHKAIERAKAWDPKNLTLVLKQVLWHKASGDYAAALAELDRAEEIAPENPVIAGLRSELLHLLGRHEEALQIAKATDRISRASGRPPREEALNALAYSRAVGDIEVEAGLSEANEALDLAAGSQLVPAILDTRGLLLYRQEKYEAALLDMNPAVKAFEGWLKRAEEQRPNHDRILSYSDLAEPPLEAARRGAAVVRYHRALVLEKLGRHAEAKLDRARAKQLIGREPDETLF
jgi:tetratricopeptide (TPR) repeat protein